MTLDEHARAGIAAINEQRFDEAIEHFTQALAIEDRPDLNSALGMAYLHRGEVGSALPYLEHARTLAEAFDQPEHQDMKRHFHLTLASAYEVADRVGDARRVLEEAVTRWPEAAPVRVQLAQLLVGSGHLEEGLRVFRELASMEGLAEEERGAADAVAGAIRAFQDSEHEPDVFLRGHQESYRDYFDEVARQQEGWYAEAARMARGPDGEPRPIVAEGARPYALTRVDLVNPNDGNVYGVYSEQDVMIVRLSGLEPLAEVPVLLPWKAWPFEAWVSTRCPWHWLSIAIQFERAGGEDDLVDRVDDLIGSWYLAGYNGEFGEKESGRFHYVTDPAVVGDRAVTYAVDLGRARYEAIPTLLNRLSVLHERHPIRRVVLGQGKLPE